MTFDSVSFWIFFAVAWLCWRFLPFRAAKASALVGSLFFYGWWNPWFLGLILFSSVVDYAAGGRIHASETSTGRRAWLAVSLVTNLGLLAVFKYGPFVAQNLAHVGLGFALEGWIIPVGISFYTFQTLSYSLDVYRGRLTPCSSFSDFALYVAFFPQLVAGPIVRARELLPQLRARRRLTPTVVQAGLRHVITGLFLKMVVADNLAIVVDNVFVQATLPERSPTAVWFGVCSFGMQIFADFAGYSGIAIGLAYLLGLRFPENFRAPYISRGLSEFWTRWHVTLSAWLRDYLYISLGGNRKGALRTLVNLMLTMLLGGLWHGASWTFVAWGGLHGAGLIFERLVRGDAAREETRNASLPSAAFAMLVTFVFVQTTWVFFRATDFPMAWTILERMYVAPFREGFRFSEVRGVMFLVLFVPVAVLHAERLLREAKRLRPRPIVYAAACGVMLFLLTVIERKPGVAFLYFQF